MSHLSLSNVDLPKIDSALTSVSTDISFWQDTSLNTMGSDRVTPADQWLSAALASSVASSSTNGSSQEVKATTNNGNPFINTKSMHVASPIFGSSDMSLTPPVGGILSPASLAAARPGGCSVGTPHTRQQPGQGVQGHRPHRQEVSRRAGRLPTQGTASCDDIHSDGALSRPVVLSHTNPFLPTFSGKESGKTQNLSPIGFRNSSSPLPAPCWERLPAASPLVNPSTNKGNSTGQQAKTCSPHIDKGCYSLLGTDREQGKFSQSTMDAARVAQPLPLSPVNKQPACRLGLWSATQSKTHEVLPHSSTTAAVDPPHRHLITEFNDCNKHKIKGAGNSTVDGATKSRRVLSPSMAPELYKCLTPMPELPNGSDEQHMGTMTTVDGTLLKGGHYMPTYGRYPAAAGLRQSPSSVNTGCYCHIMNDTSFCPIHDTVAKQLGYVTRQSGQQANLKSDTLPDISGNGLLTLANTEAIATSNSNSLVQSHISDCQQTKELAQHLTPLSVQVGEVMSAPPVGVMPVHFQEPPTKGGSVDYNGINQTALGGNDKSQVNKPIPTGIISQGGAFTGPPRYSTVVQGQPVQQLSHMDNIGQLKAPVATGKEILPERYNMKMCWKSYVQTFRECAILNGWDPIIAGQRLKLSLNTEARELAQHVAGLPAIGPLDEIISLLNPVFSNLYGEGRAATEFDLRTKKEGESYQEFVLALYKLFNQAYPGEQMASRDSRVARRFILGLGDLELSKYLIDFDISNPMLLARLAERRKCTNEELEAAAAQKALRGEGEMAGVLAYTKSNDFGVRVHPAAIKLIGDMVTKTFAEKLAATQEKQQLQNQPQKTPQKQQNNNKKGKWRQKRQQGNPAQQSNANNANTQSGPPTKPAHEQQQKGNVQGLPGMDPSQRPANKGSN